MDIDKIYNPDQKPNRMKPVMLFCGMDMEFSGGLNDCVGTYDSAEEAIKALENDVDRIWSRDLVQIFNTRTGDVIVEDWSGEEPNYVLATHISIMTGR